MNILDLYQALLLENENGEIARNVLQQAHWFSINAVFDPRTGNPLPQSLTCFLKRIANSDGVRESSRPVHDRLWRIVSHSRMAVEHIMFSLNESPQREHALLPIRAVRELDANSFIKLSTRPGRNVREKLAGKPYLQAVRRYQSVNLPENRLFKAFLIRLLPLLKKRYEIFSVVFHEDQDALVSKIENWLRTDEAQMIARWDNLPPNNTLLSHRDYRRVWDSWTWLRTLDSDIEKDVSDVENRQITVDFWKRIATLKLNKDHAFAETPVLFDFNSFKIWTLSCSMLFLRTRGRSFVIRDCRIPQIKTAGQSPKDLNIEPIDKPVCVDFTRLRPVCAIDKSVRTIPAGLIWQRWSSGGQSYDISALQADAVFSDDSVKTITSSDLFFLKELDRAEADCAALSIARDLRQIFLNDSLIWLFPDCLSDFELEIIRRNINSSFPYATPLPRSIAAVFQNVDFSQIRGHDYSVLVVDVLPGHISATKLVAKYSEEQKKAIPETEGYAWERHPCVNLDISGFVESIDYEAVDKTGSWNEVKQKMPDSRLIDLKQLQEEPQIGKVSLSIVLTDAPVAGGLRVSELQAKAPDIPLWYDHLPELSTRIGLTPEFYFVKKAKVAPQRGRSVRIPIADRFLLPANTLRYEFPLYRGSGSSKIKYMAVLTSRDFPLSEDTQCHLEMFYTYGANNPYSLYFVPENAASKKYVAQWVASDDVIDIDALPVPVFPPSHCWHDYYKWPRKDGNGVSDLFDWTQSKLEQLAKYTHPDEYYQEGIRRKKAKFLEIIQGLSQKQNELLSELRRAEIASPIKQDKKKNDFCFARLDDGQRVFIPPTCIKGHVDKAALSIGREVWICTKPGKDASQSLKATCLSLDKTLPASLQKAVNAIESKKEKIKKRMDSLAPEQLRFNDQKASAGILRKMQYPIGTLWSNGRSMSDPDVPEDFRSTIVQWMKYIRESLKDPVLYFDFHRELMYLCCCMHQDCPSDVIQHFARMDDEEFVKFPRNISMLIGSGNLLWQKQLLERFIKQIPKHMFLLRDLANLLWRTEYIVFSLADKDCDLICSALQESLNSLILQLQTNYPPDRHEIEKCMAAKDVSEEIACMKLKERYTRPIVINLEILFALLRLRKQRNLKLAKDLLPNAQVNLNFLDQLRHLSQVLNDKKLTLKTRLAMNVSKPVAFKGVPDLLYAVYMYLTGDSCANTICINSVDEQDDEPED